MNTSIVGKQFELTDSIKNYVENAFDNLGKYNLDIISARCVISADEKNGKKGFVVDFSLNLAKKDTIIIRQKDKDLYAAIDNIVDRASKVLRRHHDKMTTHKNKDDLKDIAYTQMGGGLPEEVDGADEVVPVELKTYKPMEIEEALSALKHSDKQFLVFNDMDAKMRVLYKKTDGKFGLY